MNGIKLNDLQEGDVIIMANKTNTVKTLKYTGIDGKTYDVGIGIGMYLYDEAMYLDLIDVNDPDNEPLTDITVNIPVMGGLDENEVVLDVSNSTEIVKFITENHLGEYAGRDARSGYVTYPVFKMDMAAIKPFIIRDYNEENVEFM